MNLPSNSVSKPANRQELRHFGLLTSLILVILFGFLLPWLRHHVRPQWPWLIGAVLSALALVAPMALQPIYHGWMKVGLVLGFINTRIILGVIFYGLLTPIGWLMGILNKRTLPRAFDSEALTYRITSDSKSIINMEKPF
ncbi:SxtJ family membrane protein [Leptothoe sp. EHU-05/26/07-4]